MASDGLSLTDLGASGLLGRGNHVVFGTRQILMHHKLVFKFRIIEYDVLSAMV